MATELSNYQYSNRTDAHGGKIETSLGMYVSLKKLQSEWAVDEENAQLGASKFIGIGGPMQINWNSQENIATSCISGIHSCGTLEKGAVLFNTLLDLLVSGLKEIDQKCYSKIMRGFGLLILCLLLNLLLLQLDEL